MTSGAKRRSVLNQQRAAPALSRATSLPARSEWLWRRGDTQPTPAAALAADNRRVATFTSGPTERRCAALGDNEAAAPKREPRLAVGRSGALGHKEAAAAAPEREPGICCAWSHHSPLCSLVQLRSAGLTFELRRPTRQDALGRQRTIYMPWLLPAQGGLPRWVASRARG